MQYQACHAFKNDFRNWFFVVFFSQKLQVWGGSRGVYLLCLEDIDCLAPEYVPMALEQYFVLRGV